VVVQNFDTVRVYRELAAETEHRRARYRAFVMASVTPEETDAIRIHLQHQHLYGPDRFRHAIEAQLGRSVGPRKIGRPCKAPPSSQSVTNQESLL